jgi:cell wall-associated NlpC family hydrolase
MVDPVGLVKYATKLTGIPYVFGAKAGKDDTDIERIDCSGLTFHVFRHWGILLPHGSYRQAVSRLVKECTVADALRTPGALLFHYSEKKGRVDHVGISDGTGGVIEATPPKSRHVERTPRSRWQIARLVKGVHY